MLFWIFVVALIVGIIGAVIYVRTSFDCDWLCMLSAIVIGVAIIALIVSGIVFMCSFSGLDGYVAENQARYESLTYQYENDLYDNDNDLGKKELMDEIREWNEDLAYYQKAQDDFWVGIYIPDVYDQFEFIEYK